MASVLPQPAASHLNGFKSIPVQAIEFADVDSIPELELEKQEPRTIDQLIKLLVEQAACVYSKVIPQRIHSDQPVQVVGMLGDSDLSYLISLLAISRLGHTALLLSTRITDEAYESLLSTTKATVFFYQASFSSAATSVAHKLSHLRTAVIINSKDLVNGTARLVPAALDPQRETKNGSFIIHSSGSTGLPKPIYQTHSASLYTYSQHFGLVGHLTLPLYHNHGICFTFRAIHSRKMIYLYNARLPLASQHLLATLGEHPEIQILYGVPYALKLLAETDEAINLLSRLDIGTFGGSAGPKPIGDSVVENGVNLVGHYRATEVGQLMTSFRDFENDKLWDWLRVPDRLLPYLSMEPREPNLFELCVKEGWGSKVATNREDGSYATEDLVEPHPTLANTWRYYARLDDTIVLENGEKANPLLVEGVLRQNRNVAEAIVFGAGKPRLGAFVIPKPDERHDQEFAARLEYRRTDKGTVIRAAFYRDFAKQIDASYVDDKGGSLRLSRDDLIAFLRQEFSSKLAATHDIEFDDDTDLFSLGLDSIQAIQIRSAILKNIDLDGKELGRNFVFDFPALSLMAIEILRLRTGQPQEMKTSTEERMAAMVEKYSDFDRHEPIDREADGDYVVVTGATGSLGARVVAPLASQEQVRKIYCLVRAPTMSSATARVEESLRSRGLYNSLTLEALQKIVAIPSDFSKNLLGLDWRLYDEIALNITHVLHLAWSVNFNKGLESFEADCIAGVRNLINLCLKAKRPQPASFNFCSSVSATVRTPGSIVPEALSESFAGAQGMGYAQSKLVTEHLCDQASQLRGINARVLRVGQVVGDTQNGVWNATEAIPMIFQTAKTIGLLPKLDERPSWLPVDVVAQTFIDISYSTTSQRFFNLAKYNTFDWTDELLPLLKQAGLGFEEVEQREWIRRLRASNPAPEVNPLIKLADFFASKYDTDEVRTGMRYETGFARKESEALRVVGVVDGELVGKIVRYLREVGGL